MPRIERPGGGFVKALGGRGNGADSSTSAKTLEKRDGPERNGLGDPTW